MNKSDNIETIQQQADKIKAERKRKFEANKQKSLDRAARSWGYKSWADMIEVEGEDCIITREINNDTV